MCVCRVNLHGAIAHELCGLLFSTMWRVIRQKARSHYLCRGLLSTVHSHLHCVEYYSPQCWGFFSTRLSHISCLDDCSTRGARMQIVCMIILHNVGDYSPHCFLTLVVWMFILRIALTYELCRWLSYTLSRIVLHKALSHQLRWGLLCSGRSHASSRKWFSTMFSHINFVKDYSA